MVRLIVRHLSGARATEVEVVPIGAHQELILGRAPSAAVRFDPRQDPTVGRYHARIVPGSVPSELLIDDLKSRNGTWLNGFPVSGPTVLRSGDTVRLGATGPELELSIDVSD
jgi:pSer/pThr/pTyr-binding forkhead associated (FHA) protein